MIDQGKVNAALVDALGSALRDGAHGLKTVPGLLRNILKDGAWRDFVTQRGERVQHRRFEDFVTTLPLKGLGATMELVERIVGTDDPELLILLRDAKSVGKGTRSDLLPVDSAGSNGELAVESTTSVQNTSYAAARLAVEAPDEYAAVQRGEKSIHAAAVAAGIRKRRIPVRLDDASSALRSLRANSSPEFWDEFRRLVLESEQ